MTTQERTACAVKKGIRTSLTILAEQCRQYGEPEAAALLVLAGVRLTAARVNATFEEMALEEYHHYLEAERGLRRYAKLTGQPVKPNGHPRTLGVRGRTLGERRGTLGVRGTTLGERRGRLYDSH